MFVRTDKMVRLVRLPRCRVLLASAWGQFLDEGVGSQAAAAAGHKGVSNTGCGPAAVSENL
jgi:hypothetical protein